MNKTIANLPCTKFLGLVVDDTLTWNNRIDSEIYHTNTRQHENLHQPSLNVTKYQKGVYYLDVKVFNMLPPYIKTECDNPKKFKVVLQKFLLDNSVYSLEEYFELQKS